MARLERHSKLLIRIRDGGLYLIICFVIITYIFLEFIREALGQGVRLDGRNPHEFREIEVTLSRSEVSATATVVIGRTRVISVVSGEIIAPYPDRPTEGERIRTVCRV